MQYKKDGNAYIDFKDADASRYEKCLVCSYTNYYDLIYAFRALTKCLFKKDFNLDVDLPKDTLCPPIPNR